MAEFMKLFPPITITLKALKTQKSYRIKFLKTGLRKTKFDNGTAVYVNYGSTRLTSEAGEVAAGSYIFTKGEKK